MPHRRLRAGLAAPAPRAAPLLETAVCAGPAVARAAPGTGGRPRTDTRARTRSRGRTAPGTRPAERAGERPPRARSCRSRQDPRSGQPIPRRRAPHPEPTPAPQTRHPARPARLRVRPTVRAQPDSNPAVGPSAWHRRGEHVERGGSNPECRDHDPAAGTHLIGADRAGTMSSHVHRCQCVSASVTVGWATTRTDTAHRPNPLLRIYSAFRVAAPTANDPKMRTSRDSRAIAQRAVK